MLAFLPQPVLEGGVADRDPVEKIAAIKRQRGLPTVRIVAGREGAEGDRVHREPLEIEPHRLSVARQRAGAGSREVLAQFRERVFEAVAGLGAAAIAPEERGDPVVPQRSVRGERERRQQPARFGAGDPAFAAVAADEREPPEDRQLRLGHDAISPALVRFSRLFPAAFPARSRPHG